MSKHTPGPWKCRADNTGVDVSGSDGFMLARIAWFDEAGDPAGDNDPAVANANLIAAAPDMLAALKPFAAAHAAFVETMQNFTVTGETLAERRASEGECLDTAKERAYEVLAGITLEHLAAAVAAIAKAEGRE